MALVLVVLKNEKDRRISVITSSAKPRIDVSHSTTVGDPGTLRIHEEKSYGDPIAVFSLAEAIGAYVHVEKPADLPFIKGTVEQTEGE